MRHASYRLTPALIALLLAVAVGCGDGSDEGEPGPGGSSSDTPAQREIRSVVDGLYDDLAAYDAAGVCRRMSPTARKQIAQGAIGTPAKSGATCAESFGRFLALAKRQGGLKQTLTAKVGEIEVTGERALVTVRFGQQTGQIPLRRVDGEWKMGVAVATPSTAPPAGK